MGHDVFISYSSKNSTTAQAICHELEDNGVRCWMAPRNIPVGSKYASVITQAIKECKAVVLVFSEQSAISPWVESEINIAFSNRKPIVPYKIDAATLENYDEFYLMLNNRHWIEAYPDFKTRFAELVTVVSSLVGVVPTESNKSNEVVVQSHTKTYKVGDYYDDGVKQGVVFDVWDDGRHGKIVSLDQAELQWCTDEQANQEILVGVSDNSDGLSNTNKVTISSDIVMYPAFLWCLESGDDWYLPAIDELKLLLLRNNVYNAVNTTLVRRGAKKISNRMDKEFYWSSTEQGYFHAERVNVYGIGTGEGSKKCRHYVRAVATF